MVWRSVFLAGLAFVLPTSTTQAVDTRYDRSIEAAAARIAASKLGEIRGPIGFDESAGFTRSSKPRRVTPAPKADPLRISKSLNMSEIGPVTTAGIKQPRKKTVWDRFDRYGNPIE